MRPPLLLLLARRINMLPALLLPAALVLLPPPLVVLVEDASPLQLLLRCVDRTGLDTADVEAEPLSQLNVKLSLPPPLTDANLALKSAAAAAAAAARGVPDCDRGGMGLLPPPLLLLFPPVGVVGWLLP